MPFTCEIPILDCFVRAAYLFDSPGDVELQQIGVPAFADCVVSLDGRGLLFNVLLANGARFDRLPITALWCGSAEVWTRPDGLPLGGLVRHLGAAGVANKASKAPTGAAS